MSADLHLDVKNATKDGLALAYWFVIEADTLAPVEVDIRTLATALDVDIDELATAADCPHPVIRQLATAHGVTVEELPAVGGYADLDELVTHEPIPAAKATEYYDLCESCRADACTALLNRLPRPLVWLAENGIRKNSHT